MAVVVNCQVVVFFLNNRKQGRVAKRMAEKKESIMSREVRFKL